MGRLSKSGIQGIVILGFSALVVTVITSGSLGLYAVRRSSMDAAQYIEAVDIARRAQVDFQKQFNQWYTLMIRGREFEDIKKHYHDFSFHADRVKDDLFNLKMLCDSLGIPMAGTEEMMRFHAALTVEYISGINELERSGFKNRSYVIEKTKGSDDAAIQMMEDLVTLIETDSDHRIRGIHTRYFSLSVTAFIIISVILGAMSVYLARMILTAHKKLENKVSERTYDLAETNIKLLGVNEELEDANRKITLSEERYRMLVEGSNNIIFTMDDNLNILSCSKAVHRHLKMLPGEIVGRSLVDMMCTGKDGEGAARGILMETISEFRAKRDPITFRMNLKSSFGSEPVEMDVRLEYLENGGSTEILGVASLESVDSLARYFISETGMFSIGNYLITADDVSHRLTRNLMRFLEPGEVNIMRVSLREMIINAIEHGNLDISFDEKTSAQESESYFSMLSARQNDPSLSGKKVHIAYSINDGRAIYKITDQGKGFDHRKFLGTNSQGTPNAPLCHGRGIMMTRSIFDEIRYNRKGNQVLLIKMFKHAQDLARTPLVNIPRDNSDAPSS